MSVLTDLLCRVCLKQDELLVNIYDHVEEHQADLCTLLERCGDIKVEKLDIYPKYLCQECTRELLIAAKFRTKCALTEEALRQGILSPPVIATTLIIEHYTGPALVENEAECAVDDAEDIIEYDHSSNVESYEECETQVTEQDTELETEQEVEQESEPLPEATIEETIPMAMFDCDDCGAVFQHASTLQRHIAKAHAAAESYTCSNCSHSFTQRHSLENHSCPATGADVEAEALRQSKSRHRCIYCGKCLQSASSLVTHLRLHNGERPFACDVCPKTFKTNGALVTHQKRHLKLLEYECEYCGKGFVESSNLRRHIMALHTAERPHTCTICQRSFSRVYLLELHKRTHTGERPYACNHCGRSFAQLGVLRTHERIHTGERRHRCNLCQKTFSRQMQLRKHEQKPCQAAKSEVLLRADEVVS